VQDGKFTLLAIAETLAASGIIALALYYTGFLFVLAIPAVIAPAMLLQTPDTTKRVMHYMQK